jgi:hypothetical protein
VFKIYHLNEKNFDPASLLDNLNSNIKNITQISTQLHNKDINRLVLITYNVFTRPEEEVHSLFQKISFILLFSFILITNFINYESCCVYEKRYCCNSLIIIKEDKKKEDKK